MVVKHKYFDENVGASQRYHIHSKKSSSVATTKSFFDVLSKKRYILRTSNLDILYPSKCSSICEQFSEIVNISVDSVEIHDVRNS